MNQYKSQYAEGQCHTIIRCGGTKSQQTGNITHQNEDEDRSNVVIELRCRLAHGSIHHGVQLLHDQLHHILKAFRHFSGFGHTAVGDNSKTNDDQHDDQHTHMCGRYPYLMTEKGILKHAMYHKIDIIGTG